MAKLTMKKGSTDVTLLVWIADSSSTVGAGLTALAYDTASLVCYYYRPGAAGETQLTLATLATLDAAHADGGFLQVDATNMPGLYRLDLSDAVVATGVNSVVVMLHGAANMAPVVLEIDLVAYDPQDTVRLGLTAMPNVASGNAGAIVTAGTGTAQISVSSGRANADVTHIATAAVSTSSAQLGVNVVNMGGSSVSTVSESSAVPAANASLLAKLTFMATAMRNKITQDSTTQTLYADDGLTPVASSTHSDAAGTYTKGEWT